MNPLIQSTPELFAPTAEATAGGLLALIAGFILVVVFVGIVMYIYTAFALMTIAQKTKTENPWLAWIPFGNLYLLSRIAKMHWWPLLLMVGYILLAITGSVLSIFTEWGLIFTFLATISEIIFIIYVMIWFWKMFEAVNRPGWWALLYILPILNIVFFILLGVAAWGETPKIKKQI